MARDGQCARCGSSVTWEDCWNCGGEREFDCADEDPINFGPGESFDVCNVCHGNGGFYVCLSDATWCEANPRKGKESVARGEIETFELVERRTGALNE